MSDYDNPIGLEPIPQESNSRMLTIYIMGYFVSLKGLEPIFPDSYSGVLSNYTISLFVLRLGFEPRNHSA